MRSTPRSVLGAGLGNSAGFGLMAALGQEASFARAVPQTLRRRFHSGTGRSFRSLEMMLVGLYGRSRKRLRGAARCALGVRASTLVQAPTGRLMADMSEIVVHCDRLAGRLSHEMSKQRIEGE